MEQQNPVEPSKTYPDPTKPIIPPVKRKIKWGWVIFIGFNILFPIIFAATYIAMKNG